MWAYVVKLLFIHVRVPQRRRRPAARTTEGSHPHPILMLPYSIAEILNKYLSYGGWDQKK